MTNTSAATAPHTHRSPLGEVHTETTACERCGKLFTEINAERAARTAPADRPASRADGRTFEQKLIDQERRRDRYRRTGK